MSLTLVRKCFHLGSIFQKAPGIWVNSFAQSTAPSFEAFVTSQQKPGSHTKNDIGLYYTIPNKLWFDQLFKALPNNEFKSECLTFTETSILIRKPALEVISYLKNADYSAPINKYLLYGKYGTGKSMTLCHIIHYAFTENWLIIHVPRFLNWLNAKCEVVQSMTNENCLDIPNLGCYWLKHFKNQNEALIKKLNLRLENDYKWNIKEENKKGESYLSLIDHGILRLRYSCDVINALLREIKIMSNSGKCKVLVAIDGYNLIFQNRTKIMNQDKKFVKPEQISCVTAFKNLVQPDWHNAAAVLVADTEKEYYNFRLQSPMHLLGSIGLEFLDPFIPVEVPPLSEKEMISILTFYKSKKWLLSSDGDDELKFLCGGNPLALRKLCSWI